MNDSSARFRATSIARAVLAGVSGVPVNLRLTTHAVERYVERVKPGLEAARAELELALLIALGEIQPVAPEWLARRQRQIASMYLVAGDVVLPLDPDGPSSQMLVARTCLVPDRDSHADRVARSARKRPHRRDRRGSRPAFAPATPWTAMSASDRETGQR